jgi:uncharacterized protein YcgI (DUF1989 family)
MNGTITLPAGQARTFAVSSGTTLRIVNTFGSQVVDTWAFSADDFNEHMSIERTRVHSTSPTPKVGTVFRTNQRRPILEMKTDTSPGQHDWFLPACDAPRYQLLGFEGTHANCTDNLHGALVDLGHHLQHTPSPLSLFENAPLLSSLDTEIKPLSAAPATSSS